MLNLHDRFLVERDEAIKGLQLLLQPELLVQALDDHLDTSVLANIRTTYLRYKPGMSCIARFDLDGGFAYAKAFGDTTAVKFDKARQSLEIPGPAGPGRVFHDEAGILFSFFPNDSKLTSLSRLDDPTARSRLLARIFKAEPAWENAHFTPLNYKPERRFVAKFINSNGQAATIKFFTKEDFAAMRRSRKKLNLPPGLTVPDWIGGSKRHLAMAFSWLPGDTLRTQLEKGYIDDTGKAGETIARLHMSEQPALGKRKSVNPLEIIDSLAGQLGYLIPELAGQADKLAKKLRHWWSVRTPARRPVHGDYYDEQIIIHGTQVGMIDTDNAYLGDPANDIGRFVAHLERRSIEGTLSCDQVRQAKACLLQAYYSTAPNTKMKELNAFTALNLFQLTHQPFRYRRPDWPEQTASLLDRCEQLIKKPF